MTDVLVALGDLPGERDLVAALGRGSGLRVVRRCVDVADLLVAAALGSAPHAVVSSALAGLDRDVVGRLAGAGLGCVGVADAEPAAARLAALGLPRVVVARPGEPQEGATAIAAAVGEGAVSVAPSRREAARAGTDPRQETRRHGRSGAAGPAGDAPAGELPGRGTVVAVTGPSGAPGRTSVAVALADESSRAGVPALLVDADTYAPSVVPLLALPESLPGIAAACRAADAGRLDPAVLAGYARSIPGGPMVVAGLPRAARWTEVRPAALEAVLDVARGLAPLVVVDVGALPQPEPEPLTGELGGHRDQAALAVLDAADAIVVVGAAEPLGLLRLAEVLGAVRESWAGSPVDLVLTRCRRAAVGSDPARAAAEVLGDAAAGVERTVVVPDDRAAYDAAVLAGGTLAECAARSPARVALASWAAERYRPADEAARSTSISSSRRRAWRSFGSR